MLRVMRIGFIGAGNMASALARGLGEPALVSDVDRARAEALATEIGGEAAESNAALARDADVVLLAHKPAQLDEVAAEIRDDAKVIVSILGGVYLDALESAYPDRPVYRLMPSIPNEVKRGVLCFAGGSLRGDGPEDAIRGLAARLGTVVEMPERLMSTATAVMSCGPAFIALAAEAMIDAGVRQGLASDQAARLVVETMAGTAAYLAENENDTRALRVRVTSPGGITAKGLAALEAGGVRAAYDDAIAAAVGSPR
jgi:pyrroline-5-carboxylate reductase